MTLDKQIVMQIFGSIMKQPELLSEVDNYSLIPTDFETTFERYIFISIANLFKEGARNISVVDVDSYLSEKPHIHEIFKKYNGIEYLQDAIELSEPTNFEYYYTKLKKYNAIKDLQKLGYNTNSIYPDGDMLSDEDYKKREKFDELKVTDIFTGLKMELAATEAKYGCAAAQTAKANKNIRELIAKLQTMPEVGAPCQGDIFNTITRGGRKGKFYIFSAGSGVGKTRTMVGNCCYMAYPIRYDSRQCQWISTGSCEKVLYIGTEQVIDEIQTLILAYLTDINEDIILGGIYNDDQQDRINKALAIMDAYEDNFIITQLPEPNLSQVKTHVRHHCLKDGCEYIFYDYIFATPSLLNEFRDLAIRPDVALRMLSTLLKDLAVELDVFIMSATQITGDMEFKPGYIRNHMLLRDSKSIPDKADFGAIKAKVLSEELNLLEAACQTVGAYPNQVTDVYKMRRGKWVDVRIWSLADNGTCRFKDLFVTDANLKIISDFEIKSILLDYEDGFNKISELLALCNDGVVSSDIETMLESEENIEEEPTVMAAEPIAVTQNDWDSILF